MEGSDVKEGRRKEDRKDGGEGRKEGRKEGDSGRKDGEGSGVMKESEEEETE